MAKKIYKLVKTKQYGGYNSQYESFPFNKIFIERIPNTTEILEKELIDIGVDSKNIIKFDSYKYEDLISAGSLVEIADIYGHGMARNLIDVYPYEDIDNLYGEQYDGKTNRIDVVPNFHDKTIAPMLLYPDKITNNSITYNNFLDNPISKFTSYEILEYYNTYHVISEAYKKNYRNVLYLKGNAILLPYFKENFNKLFNKVKNDYDVLILGVKSSENKFDTIVPYLCKPNKNFAAKKERYWTDNVYAIVFNDKAIDILYKKLKYMKNKLNIMLSKIFNKHLNVYYPCVNLVALRKISDKDTSSDTTTIEKKDVDIDKEKDVLVKEVIDKKIEIIKPVDITEEIEIISINEEDEEDILEGYVDEDVVESEENGDSVLDNIEEQANKDK
jgi:hypothetical protein